MPECLCEVTTLEPQRAGWPEPVALNVERLSREWGGGLSDPGDSDFARGLLQGRGSGGWITHPGGGSQRVDKGRIRKLRGWQEVGLPLISI